MNTLREIYLSAFETAVKDSKPWTIMCSYNRINGTFAAENKRLLTDILRDEWGFDGYVMSDWGATTADRVKCLEAGMELEMPGKKTPQTTSRSLTRSTTALDQGTRYRCGAHFEHCSQIHRK